MLVIRWSSVPIQVIKKVIARRQKTGRYSHNSNRLLRGKSRATKFGMVQTQSHAHNRHLLPCVATSEVINFMEQFFKKKSSRLGSRLRVSGSKLVNWKKYWELALAEKLCNLLKKKKTTKNDSKLNSWNMLMAYFCFSPLNVFLLRRYVGALWAMSLYLIAL